MIDLVLHALVEPRRRQILRLINAEERSAGEIAAHFEVTRPAISQHLQILSEARLVTVRSQGTRRYYRARPEGLGELRQFLDGFWTDRLQTRKHEAEAEESSIRAGDGAAI